MVISSLSQPIPGFSIKLCVQGKFCVYGSDVCWGELILSRLVWQANILLPICCDWEDVHSVNGFER